MTERSSKWQTLVMVVLGITIGALIATDWLGNQLLSTFKTETIGESTDSVAHSIPPLFYDTIGQTPLPPNEGRVEPLEPQKFTIEIQVFRSEKKAQRLVTRLKDKGIESFYTPLNREGTVIYRVRSGIFTSQKQSKEHRERLSKVLKRELQTMAL
ncbi:MAG: SPOR domain-containing protein [Pseudobacteriovorax sp.]|nr:SPOR domain-containing protein [Pseudobacteriovorax sp.]